MTPLFKKLNYKDQNRIFVLNPPPSFEEELQRMSEHTVILKKISKSTPIEFVIAFVKTQAQIDQALSLIHASLSADPIIWFCYPKGSSKKYSCEFNRDNGWASMGPLNLEPVRMVSMDEDWSALRFRKVEHIKKITRRESFALTVEAKKRTIQKGV